MTLALRRAFEEKIKSQKEELVKLRERRLDCDPDRRTVYDTAIDCELEKLWSLMAAQLEQ